MYMKNVDNVCTQLVKFSGHLLLPQIVHKWLDSQFVENQRKIIINSLEENLLTAR